MTNITSEMTPNEQKIQSRIDRFFSQINLCEYHVVAHPMALKKHPEFEQTEPRPAC